MTKNKNHGPNITVPQHAHSFVRFIYSKMIGDKWTHSKLERISGVSQKSLHKWRSTCNPQLLNLEAVLNTLGYKLIIVSIGELDHA